MEGKETGLNSSFIKREILRKKNAYVIENKVKVNQDVFAKKKLVDF